MTTKDSIKLAPFDAAEFLDDDKAIGAYLMEAFESGNPGEIAEAIGTVARARGMTQVAREAGVSRESLYRALSKDGNPELSTLLGVMKACGMQLAARRKTALSKRPAAKAKGVRAGKRGKWKRRGGRAPVAKAS